jgi:ABC-type Fe3+-citrate transport system substrate-binding protein
MSKNSLIRCLIILIILVNACSKSDENSVTATNEVVNGINKSNMLNLINSYRATGCNCGTVKMPAVAKLIW